MPIELRSAESTPIRGLALAIVALVLVAPTTSPRAELTRDQQRCVDTQNQHLRKVVTVVDKRLERCVRAISSGSDTRPLTQCTLDDNSGAIARAAQRAASADARRCQGNDSNGDPKAPAVFYTGSVNVTATAKDLATALDPSLFGGVGVFLRSEERFGAPCQRSAVKAFRKCQETRLKEFERCKRRALKVGQTPFPSGATTPAELQLCILDDPRGQIARRCELGIPDAIERGCRDHSANETFIFPGTCPACDPADGQCLADCLSPPIDCAFCQALNQADGLAEDCDLFDDGASNGSCI